MASKGRKGSLPAASRSGEGGVLSRVSSTISNSPVVYRGRRAASDAATVAMKLFRSAGKAAWIAGTTFLILVVPLIIEMDREQQVNELDMQQATLLGASPAPPSALAAAAPTK